MVRAYWGSLFDPSREAGVDETYRRKTSDARERDVERGRIGQTRNIRRRYVLPGTKTKKKSNVHGIYDDNQGGPARPHIAAAGADVPTSFGSAGGGGGG